MDPCQAATHWAKRFSLASRAILDVSLRPWGLGATQYQVLWHLAHDGPLPQRDLQTLLSIEKPTLSEVISALVRKGLAAQTPNPKDQRQKLLSLTQAGLVLWQSLRDPTDLILQTAFHSGPEAKLALISRVLQTGTQRLQTHLNEGKKPWPS